MIALLLVAGLNAANITAVAIAPNGNATAIATTDPPELWLGSARIALPAAATEPRLVWSPDSKYVAVEVEVSDDESDVAVVDAARSTLIDAGHGHSVRWRRSGHTLLIVPDFGAAELPTTPGLIAFDPSTRKKETLAGDYYFLGIYDAGETKIVGQGLRVVDGKPVYALVECGFTARCR